MHCTVKLIYGFIELRAQNYNALNTLAVSQNAACSAPPAMFVPVLNTRKWSTYSANMYSVLIVHECYTAMLTDCCIRQVTRFALYVPVNSPCAYEYAMHTRS